MNKLKTNYPCDLQLWLTYILALFFHLCKKKICKRSWYVILISAGVSQKYLKIIPFLVVGFTKDF